MTAGEPSRPQPDQDFLADGLAAVGADGFVHAGTAADADLRYLTGVADDSDRIAFGYVDGTALLVLPPGTAAPPVFPGHVEHIDGGTTPAARIATALAERRDGGVIAAPRQLPHDAARYLQSAGFELTSTTAVVDARAIKTDAELAAVARAADAAMAGMKRARDLLADANVGGRTLRSGGEPLTAARLRQAIDAAVVLAGGQPAENTCVATGPRPNRTPDRVGTETDAGDGLPAAEPIRIGLAPRDPAGYHAPLARTLTVDGSGGWERRAHVACESARRAGVAAASAGGPAAGVAEELLAELGAYGFDPHREAGAAGTGVGLSRTERPSLSGTADLQAGMVLSLTPSLSADAETGVALADTVVVADEETRVLTHCSTGMAPGPK